MLVSLDFFRTIIDRIVDDLKTTKDKLQLLQPKITGQSGQVVGFDSDGNVVATDKPSYTAQEVGALPATTAIPSTATDVNAEPIGSVSQHDASDAAHSDIRLLIRGLSERLSAVADSDDATLDQLSEIVAYIKSNKSLIDAITTSKVNVADIVNDLTTSVANKPLSAAQGVAIKKLIDAITVPTALSELSEDANHRVVTDAEKAVWNAKSNFSGSYNDLTDKPTIPDVPVQSVNGKTGAVALSAVDVGALPDSTVIPSQYTLPIASSTQLGGVQPAAKTETMTQAVGVDAGGALWTAPGSGEGGGTTPELVYSHTCDGTYVSVLDDFQLEEDKIYITFMNLPTGTGTAIYYCMIGSNATYMGAACGFANKQNSVVAKRSSVTQLFKDGCIRLLSGIFPDVPSNYYAAFSQYKPGLVVNKIYIYSTESGTNLPEGLKVEVYKLN